jgi:hypothetical protein
MNDLLIGILFILFLAIIGAFIWAWRLVSARLKAQDEKLNESLDDLDLVEFQESVAQLLDALHKAGAELVKQAEERSRSMLALSDKGKELEKRLAQRLAQFEKQLARADSLYGKLEARIPARAPRTAPDAGPKAAKATRPALSKTKAPARAPGAFVPLEPALKPAFQPAAEEEPSPEIEQAEGPQPASAPKPAGKYAHVQEMAEQGMSVEQIARQAHLLPGEVELILRLGKKR